jgi:hypothetical protein
MCGILGGAHIDIPSKRFNDTYRPVSALTLSQRIQGWRETFNAKNLECVAARHVHSVVGV